MLESQQGSSQIVVGKLDPALPSQPLLRVEGLGQVGLPVIRTQAWDVMERAPFGLGEATVRDTKVLTSGAGEVSTGEQGFCGCSGVSGAE